MAHDAQSNRDAGGDAATDVAGEVLLVGELESTRLIAESLEADEHQCTCVDGIEAARRRVLEARDDVIVLDLDVFGGRVFEVVQLAARLSPATLCVLRSRSATVESVVAAMRAGIGDYLVGTLSVPQLRTRIRAAIRRARHARARLERVARMTSLCRSLVARKGAGPADVDELAALMGDAGGGAADDGNGRTSLTAPRESGKPASEEAQRGRAPADDSPFAVSFFHEMARQHLDAEQLVTASIEHLIGEFGAINVAVYLGTGSCRFGLAAYARADLPRALIEAALVRWSDDVCTMAAADGRVRILPEASILYLQPGAQADDPENETNSAATEQSSAAKDKSRKTNDAVPSARDTMNELARRAAILVPCKHEGVCDAVFILLPQAGSTVQSSAARELDAFAQAFAQQLQLIQRIHTRYRPTWPNEPD